MNTTTDLPETFVVEMPDDALAPTIAKGAQLIFSTQERPRPGVGVLVADQDGRRYVRRYAHNEPGTRFRLLADAINPDYATLRDQPQEGPGAGRDDRPPGRPDLRANQMGKVTRKGLAPPDDPMFSGSPEVFSRVSFRQSPAEANKTPEPQETEQDGITAEALRRTQARRLLKAPRDRNRGPSK